jgi:hypothetical protein
MCSVATGSSNERSGLPALACSKYEAGISATMSVAAAVDSASPKLGTTLLPLVVSAASLVLLVRRERPKAAPLIPLDLLRVKSFRVSIIASVCCFTGQMMGFMALPFYFQHGLRMVVFTSLAGLGFGLFQTPNNQNMLLAAPKERGGAAGGAQGTARLTGLTLGRLPTGLLFALLPSSVAVHWGLTLAALAALAGGVISLSRSPARAGSEAR